MHIPILVFLTLYIQSAQGMNIVGLGGVEHKITQSSHDPERNKQLFEILKKRELDLARLATLLKQGADSNARDAEGYTPLMLSAGRTDGTEALKLLLSYKAQPDTQAKDGRTALMLTALAGNSDGAQILLAAKANPNLSDAQGKTALMYALEHEQPEIFTELIRNKADIQKADNQGLTALMLAVDIGNKDLVQELLKLNALTTMIDKDGNTALMRAILKKNKPIARLLVPATNPFIQNKAGHTARTLAQNRGLVKLAYMLEQEELNWKQNGRYQEWLKTGSALIDAAKKSDTDTLRKLFDEAAPINARDMQQKTPLMHAAAHGSPEVVRMMLEHDADLACYDREGNTALMQAICHNSKNAVLPLLLKATADVNAQNPEGKTALMTAVLEGNETAVKELLAHGARVDVKTQDNRSALTLAALKGDAKIMKLLLNAPHSFTEQDFNTMYAIAKHYNRTEIMELLDACKKAKKTSSSCIIA